MTSHSGRVFLNSCVKVPMDPCNNCPAPIYNRPKMYFGRHTGTPTITTTATTTTTKTVMKCPEIDTETSVWSSQGVRCLAKFYDSIPEYGEINHLPEEEFYSTLDTLRTTCRRLKTKSSPKAYGSVEYGAENPPTGSTIHPTARSTKSKSKKKKTKTKSASKCLAEPSSLRTQVSNLDRLHSFKDDFQEEVDAFKQSLRQLEEELKQRPKSSAVTRSRTVDPLRRRVAPAAHEISPFKAESTKSLHQRNPGKSRSASDLRESLRKAFSLNDIPSVDTPTTQQIERIEQRGSSMKTVECPTLENKMSHYFEDPTKKRPEGKPEVAASPNTCTSSSGSSAATSSRKKKLKGKRGGGDPMKVPFSLFNLSGPSKENVDGRPSPMHPVARPNLAATLRAEVSRRKLKELQINCTFNDPTPQIDWEVRKTPAWRSLTLNETHKQILALRLATRKAEQALQEREYQMHMELMRQRVKSAPLLLEGPTYWAPTVGKLTHTCPTERVTHSCHSTQRKLRKKGTRSRRASSEFECTAAPDSYCSSRFSTKTETLNKIYGTTQKGTRRGTLGKSKRSGERPAKTSSTPSTHGQQVGHHCSGDDDDLSSEDRAFL